MKHNIAAYITLSVVAVLCGSAVLAQAGQDDQGQANDPRTSARANACYPEGSLAGECVTEAQWDCGWSLIRFEYGLLTSLPTACASLFPNVTTSSGQNPFLSVTAFDINATQDPSSTSDESCTWSSAFQSPPMLRDQAVSAVYTTGLSVNDLTVTTYGENCVNQNGEVVSFAAQYTTFEIAVAVPTDTTESAVQTAIIAALQTLSNVPGSSNPQFAFQFLTVEPTMVPSVTPAPYPNCNWSWARQPRPDLAQQASATVSAAGYTATVNAYLYGEDCYTREGQFVYFGAMDTNFDVTVTVDANVNQSTIYEAVNTAIRGLGGMPTSQVNVRVSFVIAKPTEETTPEASPDVETTPESTPPTEEASPEITPDVTVMPMPTATPRTGDCKPTDPCGA